MNNSWKILFTILFVFDKYAFSTRWPKHISMEYDITKHLDTCVSNMFKDVDSYSVWTILKEMKNSKMYEFGYKLDFKTENFKRKVYFRDISFFVTDCMLPKIDWDFSKDKLHISVEKLSFHVTGNLHVTKNESYSIHAQMNLLNASINITASEKTPNNIELSLTQDSFSMLHGKEYYWTPNGDENNTTISDDKKNILDMILLEALPLMFIKHLNRHQIFDTIYNHYNRLKNQIISTYPDFPNNEKKFYYFVPRIPFWCFDFKLIMIKGLSNFQRIQVRSTRYPFTHTLLIKDIEGRLDLDYGTEDEKPLKLNFKIDNLTISINDEKNHVNVSAEYYQVNQTSGPLNNRLSEVVMHAIESIIASSMLPSMQDQGISLARVRPYLDEKIRTTQKYHRKKMKRPTKSGLHSITTIPE